VPVHQLDAFLAAVQPPLRPKSICILPKYVTVSVDDGRVDADYGATGQILPTQTDPVWRDHSLERVRHSRVYTQSFFDACLAMGVVKKGIVIENTWERGLQIFKFKTLRKGDVGRELARPICLVNLVLQSLVCGLVV
jgi:hypothetical protein